jgi:hypothetical protein
MTIKWHDGGSTVNSQNVYQTCQRQWTAFKIKFISKTPSITLRALIYTVRTTYQTSTKQAYVLQDTKDLTQPHTNPGRINFVGRCLMCGGYHYGTCFNGTLLAPRLFLVAPIVLENFWTPHLTPLYELLQGYVVSNNKR